MNIDYKTSNSLKIFRGNLFAGTLKRTENGCLFEFEKSFIDSDQYRFLTFNINKRRTKIFTNGYNLPSFFANLLPEGLRLKALVKKLKTSEDDMFTLFAATGNNIIGDVYAYYKNNSDHSLKPKLSEVDFYELFTSTLEQIIPSWQGNDTLAGIQEKISASMITFPLNIVSDKSSYILKLNPKTHNNLVENEFIIMNLAQLCGLKTAKVKLVKDKNKNTGLLVKRFDKEFIDGKQISHHQEDGCQILDKYPADKYRISLNEIAKKILDLVPSPQTSILSLLKLYSFSYLIGNGDLHAKNISLMQKASSTFIELTPAYDLICTYIYGDRKMAIKIDGRDDNIKATTIINFASRFEIPEKATISMLTKLTTKLQNNLNLLFQINMPPKIENLLKNVISKRLEDMSL